VEQLKAEGDSFEAVKGILTNFINYFDEYLDGPGIFGDDDILEIAGDYLVRRGKDARFGTKILKTSLAVYEQK
jgi:hypothetical protein